MDSSEALREREARFRREHPRNRVKVLPRDAEDWEDHECDLWFHTAGAFHPRRALRHFGDRASLKPTSFRDFVLAGAPGSPEPASLRPPDGVRGRVSVVTPTSESMRWLHEVLWECFEDQRWPDKELVVVETYTTSPSEFFRELAERDRRLVYMSFKRTPQERRGTGAQPPRMAPGQQLDYSTGLKRNIGNYLASGEFIAHFDESVLYAPTYLSAMVARLRKTRAGAVKLSSWFVLDFEAGSYGECDPQARGVRPGHQRNPEGQEELYGHGFSYVYRRRVALSTPFKATSVGEDFQFFLDLLQETGSHAVGLLRDTAGMCLCVKHEGGPPAAPIWRDVTDFAEVERWHIAGSRVFLQYNRQINFRNNISDFVMVKFPLAAEEDQRDLIATLTGKELQRPLVELLVGVGTTRPILEDEVSRYVRKCFPRSMFGDDLDWGVMAN